MTVTASRLSPFRGAGRNADLGALHETFFIAAVTTILCIRTQLWLTNYPQLGGHYEVIHHTQLLQHLIDEGRLVPVTPVEGPTLSHDGPANGTAYPAPTTVRRVAEQPFESPTNPV